MSLLQRSLMRRTAQFRSTSKLLHTSLRSQLQLRALSTTLSTPQPQSSQSPPTSSTSSPFMSTPRSASAIASATDTPSLEPPSPDFPPLPYHISRTASAQLPVYHAAKSGGNRHITTIRKISGDVHALRDELQTALGLAEEQVRVNELNRQIVVKGWRKHEVARFLEERRF